jgi:pSer/pThr/pTyr-binding forkhead associated (FHA) protein
MDINLVLLRKNGSQKSIPLPSRVTVIGRRHDCDLWIPLAPVSKRHCQLSYSEGVLKLRDLSSRNGTILNGKPVDEAVVKAGDSIKIGPLTFVLQIDGKPEKIVQPDWVAENLSQQDATDEQFTDFEQFNEPDSLE